MVYYLYIIKSMVVLNNFVITNFASFYIWSQQVYNLDTSNQNFLFYTHFNERRSFSMNRSRLVSLNGTSLINWFTLNISY